jgi:hypothetical protein
VVLSDNTYTGTGVVDAEGTCWVGSSAGFASIEQPKARGENVGEVMWAEDPIMEYAFDQHTNEDRFGNVLAVTNKYALIGAIGAGGGSKAFLFEAAKASGGGNHASNQRQVILQRPKGAQVI